MKSAFVVLANGFETIEALTPVDVLRRAGINVTMVGLESLEVVSAQEITVHADTVLRAGLPEPDVIVLPGGLPGAEYLGNSELLERLVRKQLKEDRWVAAICAAPAKTLAKWGLLTDCWATCYPGCEAEFPANVHHSSEPVVVDGKIVTSRGPGTALPFAYKILEQLVSPTAAADLQRKMIYAR